MRVLSINVGRPRDIRAGRDIVTTSIFKSPVAGSVHVGKLNLEGDQQSDLTVHGGVRKAVYVYPSEHYAFWRAELADVELPWGAFRENLTTEGILEETTSIGDTLRIGSAEFVVTRLDPRRGEWQTEILPAVRRASLATLISECAGRLSRRALIDIRSGRSTPHRKNQELLASVVRKLSVALAFSPPEPSCPKMQRNEHNPALNPALIFWRERWVSDQASGISGSNPSGGAIRQAESAANRRCTGPVFLPVT